MATRKTLLRLLLVPTLAIGLAACSGGNGTAARKPTPTAKVQAVGCVTGYVAAKDGSGECLPSPLNLPAVWTLDQSSHLKPTSSSFVAEVSIIQCDSGRTGAPAAPQVKTNKAQITVTFEVLPMNLDGPQNCIGGAAVPYTVRLGSPIGHRQLVDGRCSSTEYAGTSWCNIPDGNGGVRWPR